MRSVSALLENFLYAAVGFFTFYIVGLLLWQEAPNSIQQSMSNPGLGIVILALMLAFIAFIGVVGLAIGGASLISILAFLGVELPEIGSPNEGKLGPNEIVIYAVGFIGGAFMIFVAFSFFHMSNSPIYQLGNVLETSGAGSLLGINGIGPLGLNDKVASLLSGAMAIAAIVGVIILRKNRLISATMFFAIAMGNLIVFGPEPGSIGLAIAFSIASFLAFREIAQDRSTAMDKKLNKNVVLAVGAAAAMFVIYLVYDSQKPTEVERIFNGAANIVNSLE